MSDREEGRIGVGEPLERGVPDSKPAIRIQFMPSASMQSAEHNAAEGRPSDRNQETIPARAQSNDVIAGNAAALQRRQGVQRSGGKGATADVHTAAVRGVADGGSNLPHLDTIQESFGRHDVSGVKSHVGGSAKEAAESMGAEAYATGNDVAFRESPDLHTAAHEASHIIQQRAGVALKDGVGEQGDKYEQHADAAADAVVAGKSAEGLLDQMSGDGAGDGGVQHAVQKEDADGGSGGGGGGGDETDMATESAVRSEGSEESESRTEGAAEVGTEGLETAEGDSESAHPRQGEIDADRAALKSVGTLEAFRDLVSGLQIVPTPSSKKDVPSRIKKLLKALPEAEAHLRKVYGPTEAPGLIEKWFTERRALLESKLADSYPTKAAAALGKIQSSGEVKEKDQYDFTEAMKVWAAIKPEELIVGEDALKSYDVYKAYDLAVIWEKGNDLFRAAWGAVGGQEAWMEACTSAKGVVVSPPAVEGAPPGPGLTVEQAFTGQHFGFVGVMPKGQSVPSTFAEAISALALDKKYYGSKKMIVGRASPAAVNAVIAGKKIGKPSIFNLLTFNEQTYDITNRTFGCLADPANPEKPGTMLELQVQGISVSEFMNGDLIS